MKLLLVADGRSPITRNWINMLNGLDVEIHLVSTFACNPVEGTHMEAVIPVGFSAFSGSQASGPARLRPRKIPAALSRFRPLLLKLRAYLTPLLIKNYQKHIIKIINNLKPDVIHALRIPFEGMLASCAPKHIPFVVSIWGNDLTLHAHTSPLMGTWTRKTLSRVDGLMADARRDIRLADEWGLKKDIPVLAVPGSGGLDIGRIQKTKSGKKKLNFSVPKNRPLIINSRGFRPGSVHQDIFFRSIPLVLKQVPDAYFVCTAMQGQPLAEKWVEEFGIQDYVLLLPTVNQEELWELFARSQVYTSLSSHDGTPNSFLESIALGCFPVVGDIASLREWLVDGENGLLVNPASPQESADAQVQALLHEDMRERAAVQNFCLVTEKADRTKIQDQVADFYSALL